MQVLNKYMNILSEKAIGRDLYVEVWDVYMWDNYDYFGMLDFKLSAKNVEV